MSWQLRPGCHFFRAEKGVWYALDARERARRLEIDDETGIQVLHGVTEAPDPEDDRVERLARSLVAIGVLEPWETRPRTSSGAGSHLAVHGAGTVMDTLLTAARQHLPQLRVSSVPASGMPPAGATMVLSITGTPRDETHRVIDRWCAEQSIPWTRCCREGDVVTISPVALAPGDPTYRDLRARRLAASPVGHVLERLWAGLDKEPCSGLSLAPGATHLVAGLLMELVTRVSEGRTDGVPVGEELCVSTRTLAVTRHRVLPLPDGLARAPRVGDGTAWSPDDWARRLRTTSTTASAGR